jgi:nicotinamidase-related amidase
MADMSDEEFFKSRGFGLRMGFGGHPALLVIDMIKAFTDAKRLLGANLDAQIAVTQKLLDVAHEKSVPVIFSTVRYDESDVRDAGLWALKQKGVVDLAKDSNGHEIDERLDKRKSDGLLLKKYASCFFGTDLIPRLTSRGIDTLIMTGCTTSGCVRATAVDSVQNGFRPIVVREGVGDRSATAHEQSLFDLDAKYGDVVSLEETLRYLSTIGVDAR